MSETKSGLCCLSAKLKHHYSWTFIMVLVFYGQMGLVPPVHGQESQKPIKKETPIKNTDLSAVGHDLMTGPEHALAISHLFESGLRFLRNDDAESAAANLEEVLRLDPTHIPAMINLARAYIDMGQYPRAGRVIEGAIVLDWINAEAYFVKGRLHHAMGNDAEAIALYQRSIELESLNPFAYNNLALIYIQDGRFDEAVPLLEKAISQNDDVVFIHNNLGIAYEGIENLREAEKALQQALRTDPSYVKARENLERVHRKLTDRSITSGLIEGEIDPI